MMLSIVTVCHNSAAVLPKALASLRAQSHEDREWVVIDAASTDGTLEIIRTSGEKLGNWISEPDGGIFDAMNKGWQRAQGDVVYFLNSDDALYDDAVLARVADAFDNDPMLDLVVGEIVYCLQDGRVLCRSFRHIDANSLVYEDLCHQAVFARRALFERIGGFNASFRINADYDWLLRALRVGARVGWLDQPVAYFSTGGMHTRNFDQLVVERENVRRQYVSGSRLQMGLLRRRITRRLGLMLGLDPLGQPRRALDSR